MSHTVIFVLTALAAYGLGSVSFAIVVSRLRGLADPRSYGSHNPGATNVLRSGDKVAAALTLAGDAFKGLAAVLLAQWLSAALLDPAARLNMTVIAGIAVFVGHLFPVFFRFQGGKGVATAFGLGLMVGGLWIAVAKIFRISSLAALSAAIAAPLLTFWRHDAGPMLIAVAVISVLLIIRHRRNIEQLLSGEEKAFKKP